MPHSLSNNDNSPWTALAKALGSGSTDVSDLSDELILGAAFHHGLAPLLDQANHEGRVKGLSRECAQSLHAESQREAALDMVLNDSTAKLLALLAAEGFDVLLLKGTPMALRHYPASYLRPRCDTDIYIDAPQAEAIGALLKANGYHVQGLGSDAPSATVKQFHATRESFQGEQMWFDIHHRLSNRAVFAHCLPFEECLAFPQDVPNLGATARALSDADLLLHACIHRIAHGRNSERNRLIWLYDIHLLVQAVTPRCLNNAMERAVKMQIGAVCADAWETCQGLFGTPLPEGSLDKLRSNIKREPSAALINGGKLGWLWSDLSAQKGLGGKWQMLSEVLANRRRKH
jgi:hypothetical protein